MQQRRAFFGSFVISCLAVGLCACGGRAERTVFDGAVDDSADYPASGEPGPSQQPSAPSYSAGGSQALPASEPPESGSTPDRCAGPARPVQTNLLWEQGAGLYGMDPTPYFAFSGDGSQLITPGDEYGIDGNATFAVADGTRMPPPSARVLGRDAAWSRELRAADRFTTAGDISVVDLRLEQTLLSLGPVSRLLSLSADGDYVFGVYCQDGDRLERHRLSDNEVTSLPLDARVSPCSVANNVGYVHMDAPFAVTRSNDGVVFLADQGHDLVLASVSAGTTSVHAIYEAAPPDATQRTDSAIELQLSPNERALATVNGAGVLRLWSYPGLVQSLPDIQVSVTRAFRNCYCGPRDFAPVAFSPDERYLATADEAGQTVLRRACDGSIVATLQAPAQASFLDGYAQGPAFIAFSPNGRGLAVLSISEVYDATVSYYELSE